MSGNVVNLRVASDNPHPAIKDCRDCKWCSTPFRELGRYSDNCTNPRMGKPRPDHYWAAHSMRAADDRCGVGAAWFEPKPVKPTIFQRVKRWFA